GSAGGPCVRGQNSTLAQGPGPVLLGQRLRDRPPLFGLAGTRARAAQRTQRSWGLAKRRRPCRRNVAGLAPVGQAADAGGELPQVAGQAHAAQVAVAAAEGAPPDVDGGAGVLVLAAGGVAGQPPTVAWAGTADGHA